MSGNALVCRRKGTLDPTVHAPDAAISGCPIMTIASGSGSVPADDAFDRWMRRLGHAVGAGPYGRRSPPARTHTRLPRTRRRLRGRSASSPRSSLSSRAVTPRRRRSRCLRRRRTKSRRRRRPLHLPASRPLRTSGPGSPLCQGAGSSGGVVVLFRARVLGRSVGVAGPGSG